MKAQRLIIVCLLLALCASIALAEGEQSSSAGVPVRVEPETPVLHHQVSNQASDGVSRDDVEKSAREVSVLRQRLQGLENARRVCRNDRVLGRRINAKMSSIRRRMSGLEKQVKCLKDYSISTDRGQKKTVNFLHRQGFVTKDEVAKIVGDAIAKYDAQLNKARTSTPPARNVPPGINYWYYVYWIVGIIVFCLVIWWIVVKFRWRDQDIDDRQE